MGEDLVGMMGGFYKIPRANSYDSVAGRCKDELV